eukprot:14299368-Ditylum_brightwellii.AAC.1
MGFDMNNVITSNCSTCVEVDILTLDVLGSMNIIGHLKLPKNFHGILITLFMAVQGKLTMFPTNLVMV